MTAFYNTLPCSAGGTHEWGFRKIRPRSQEQYCVKCSTGWGGINQQMIDALPKEEGMYQGSTYLWEFDGEEWTPFRAPGGVSAHWDQPMRRVVMTYAEPTS